MGRRDAPSATAELGRMINSFIIDELTGGQGILRGG